MREEGETLLLLDVDGVISPVAPPSGAWPDFERIEDAPYWLLVSQAMGDAVADLPARRRWLTSWDGLANDWVAPALGWDPLPVVEWPGGPGARPHDLKIQGLERFLESLDPSPSSIVWCEDSLTNPRFHEAAEAALDGVPHLLIGPRTEVGLEPAHVAEMREFLRVRV